jgi:hypothetical protein
MKAHRNTIRRVVAVIPTYRSINCECPERDPDLARAAEAEWLLSENENALLGALIPLTYTCMQHSSRGCSVAAIWIDLAAWGALELR